MRSPLLIVAFFFWINLSFAQSEYWTYCFSQTFDFSVVLIDEVQTGDSLVKTYEEDYTNSQFELLYLYDTIYSKYNGNYYFLGTNNPTVGDIWNPLRYFFMSFTDSSTLCPNLMQLEVIAIDSIVFGGDTLNRIQLLDKDLDTLYGPVTYEYIENVGGTFGGPLYNLSQQYMCDVWIDFYEPHFRSFDRDTSSYINQTPCPIIGLNELNQSNQEPVKILDVMGRETIRKSNQLQLYVYKDGTVLKVYSVE